MAKIPEKTIKLVKKQLSKIDDTQLEANGMVHAAARVACVVRNYFIDLQAEAEDRQVYIPYDH